MPREGSIEVRTASGKIVVDYFFFAAGFVNSRIVKVRTFNPQGGKLLDKSSDEGGRTEEFNDRPEIDRKDLRRILLDLLEKIR